MTRATLALNNHCEQGDTWGGLLPPSMQKEHEYANSHGTPKKTLRKHE